MSGVSESAVDPWLGRLPAGWSIKRLGSLGALVKGRGGSKEDNRDAGVPVVRYGDLYTKFDTIIAEPAAFVSEEDATKYTPLPRHSIVFAASGESAEDIGKSAMSLLAEPAVVGGDAVVCHPSDEIDPLYLAYALESSPVRAFKAIRSTGFTVVHISAGKLKTLPIPIPPRAEQRAIAEYLDRETTRIDTLIEEQQRLIEMLDERRDAVITVATTKGVRPGVALVESGVEWIGDTPEGWSVKALRRCGTPLTGSTPPTDDRSNFAEEANERPWVRPQDLSSETRASAWLTAKGWSQLRPVPAGSVLVGCIAYSLGSIGYLPVTATTNQQITSIVPAEDGRYLYYVMRAAKSELWAASQMNRVPILNNQRLGAIRVPVPPVEEQRLIAAYLDEHTERIDRTKAEAKQFIEFARERRAALITAAVTGQIDVREAP